MIQRLTYYYLLLGIACVIGCQSPKTVAPRFLNVDAPASGIHFKNAIQADSLHNMIDYSYCYNGGGVGAADLDNDGLKDLFFTGNQVSCAVYKNEGNWHWSDQTTQAGLQTSGWSTGVTFADVNADGWLDIYVCRAGNYPQEERMNLLFINQQNFSFKESAAEYGLADNGWSTQALFFDYDQDGLLDCYVTNHTNSDRYPNRIKNQQNKEINGDACDHLYKQSIVAGKRIFRDVTRAAGMGDNSWGLGVSLGDFNNDNWLDLYVSNDFLGNDLLWINQQNGTFNNQIAAGTQHTSHSSMGNDVGDFDNNGFEDIFVTDMMPTTNLQRKKMAGVLTNDAFQIMLDNNYTPQYVRNTLQWNRGIVADGNKTTPSFQEIGQMSGMYATDWSWSPIWADIDLDGHLDLMISSGYRHDITDMDFIVQNSQLGSKFGLQEADKQIRDRAKQQVGYPSPIRFFHNEGGLQFSDSTTHWSPAASAYHNGTLLADLDNDGDMDLISNRIDEFPLLLENKTTQPHNWLAIKLLSTTQPANTDGIGALVKIYTSTEMQQRRVTTTKGYQSGIGPDIHFGLGQSMQIDSIVIIWPNAQRQVETGGGINQLRQIKQAIGLTSAAAAVATVTPIGSLKKIQMFDPRKQDTYNEYAGEPLLPHRYQNEYFPVASADLDGDGHTDYFVGGPGGLSGNILLHKSGGFETTLLHPETADLAHGSAYSTASEDMGAAFFDADRDGDLDLYVSSGGAQFEANSIFLQDRLYLNDGKGHFQASPDGALPKECVPGSCVVPADFDLDGDTDLFVGGRRKSFEYGAPGTSFLLENDGQGHFRDVTNTLSPGLQSIGMVTCAQWLQLDDDGRPDLVVAGELMPITVCMNQKSAFKLSPLPNSAGFWNCLTVCDVNRDGKPDLLAGNMGLNQSLGISTSTPFRVYATDLDANKHTEAVCTYFVQNKEVTFHGRDELLRQIPPLRKKFLTYNDFGSALFSDLFQPTQASLLAQAVEPRSMALLNTGGQLQMSPLPEAIQSMPIGCITDVGGRFLCTGTSLAWDVRVGNMPAATGWWLAPSLSEASPAWDLDVYAPASEVLRCVWKVGEAGPSFLLLKNGEAWVR